MVLKAALFKIGETLLLDKIGREIKKKVSHVEKEETVEERQIREKIGDAVPLVFNKKKASTSGGVLLSVAGVVVYSLSAAGYISPELAEMINNIITSAPVEDAVDCLSDESYCDKPGS